jgi:lysophospholipase L1-like esterase
MRRPGIVRPGFFGIAASADNRRSIFDIHNEVLLAKRSPIDAVFIGDSITDMWPLDAYFAGGSGGQIVNRGIGGDRTPFLRRRFEADALQLNPPLIVLLIGVNNTWDLDLWETPVLIRTPEDIEAEIVADVHAMVATARERETDIALCSILPTNIPLLATDAARNRLIAGANRRLREIATTHSAIYVDYHSQMVSTDGLTLRPDLADDGLHPHVLGYEIMASALLEALSAISTRFIATID